MSPVAAPCSSTAAATAEAISAISLTVAPNCADRRHRFAGGALDGCDLAGDLFRRLRRL
jgi:hypothetical protein